MNLTAPPERILAEVRRRVHRVFPRLDPDVVDQATDDILFKVDQRPELYNPARGDPLGWLVAMTINRVKDSLKSASRRGAHEIACGDGLPDTVAAAESPEVRMLRRAAQAEQRERLMAVALTPDERAFLRAFFSDAPDPVLAATLGDAALTGSALKMATHRIVMRFKARVDRRRR